MLGVGDIQDRAKRQRVRWETENDKEGIEGGEMSKNGRHSVHSLLVLNAARRKRKIRKMGMPEGKENDDGRNGSETSLSRKISSLE